MGWIDNLYGPTGVVAGVGTGVLRTMHCDRDINANIVPVDMTVSALISCAWDTANRYGNNQRSDSNKTLDENNNNISQNYEIYKDNYNLTCNNCDNNNNNLMYSKETSTQTDLEMVPIYNYVSSVQNPLTWGEFTELNIKHGFEFPFSSPIW